MALITASCTRSSGPILERTSAGKHLAANSFNGRRQGPITASHASRSPRRARKIRALGADASDRVPWSTIDRGVLPSPELGGKPLADVELNDERRFRAVLDAAATCKELAATLAFYRQGENDITEMRFMNAPCSVAGVSFSLLMRARHFGHAFHRTAGTSSPPT